MSHPNETMTKEEIATEFRRSMAALKEYEDGPSISLLDLRKETNRIDKRIDRLYLLSISNTTAILTFIVTLWLR